MNKPRIRSLIQETLLDAAAIKKQLISFVFVCHVSPT